MSLRMNVRDAPTPTFRFAQRPFWSQTRTTDALLTLYSRSCVLPQLVYYV